MANHESILSTRISDIKEIPALPEGSYNAVVATTPKVDKFGQKNTPGVEFSFRLKNALDDVDPEQLASAGGIPEMPLTYTFWDTPKAGGMLKSFLTDIMKVSGDQSPLEVFPELPGTECVVTIKHRASKKANSRPFPQIDGFAAAA